MWRIGVFNIYCRYVTNLVNILLCACGYHFMTWCLCKHKWYLFFACTDWNKQQQEQHWSVESGRVWVLLHPTLEPYGYLPQSLKKISYRWRVRCKMCWHAVLALKRFSSWIEYTKPWYRVPLSVIQNWHTGSSSWRWYWCTDSSFSCTEYLCSTCDIWISYCSIILICLPSLGSKAGVRGSKWVSNIW